MSELVDRIEQAIKERAVISSASSVSVVSEMVL